MCQNNQVKIIKTKEYQLGKYEKKCYHTAMSIPWDSQGNEGRLLVYRRKKILRVSFVLH